MKIEGENMGNRSNAGGGSSAVLQFAQKKLLLALHKAQPPKLPEANGCLCVAKMCLLYCWTQEVFNKSLRNSIFLPLLANGGNHALGICCNSV